ncbi:MAG: hypothetical protein M3153_06435 [Chloroflexota bacterium]|nr:hypothetical protein [Chloroflexota bacterium]
MLQVCLGPDVDVANRRVQSAHARLPLFLDHLRVDNLAVGDAHVDLSLQRQPQGIGIKLVGRRGEAGIVAVE